MSLNPTQTLTEPDVPIAESVVDVSDVDVNGAAEVDGAAITEFSDTPTDVTEADLAEADVTEAELTEVTEVLVAPPHLTRRQRRRRTEEANSEAVTKWSPRTAWSENVTSLRSVWYENRENWRRFIHSNEIGIALCYGIYIIALLAIGLVNVSYLDDSGRIMNGRTGWNTAGSRWGSEIFARLIAGSSRMTDWGIASFLLAALILATASVILVHTLLGKRATVLSFILATVLGLNPWFLNAAAFRLDGPLIAMSVLLAILPFLFLKARWPVVFVVFLVFLYAVFNFYETSIGLTLTLLTTLLLVRLLRGTAPVRDTLPRFAAAYLGSFLGFALGLVQTNLQQRFGTLINQGAGMPNPAQIPFSFQRNFLAYGRRLLLDSNNTWRLSYLLVAVAFAIFVIGISRYHPIRTIVALVLFALTAFIASASFWLLLPGPTIAGAPRYMYPFAMWVTSLAVVASGRWPSGAPRGLSTFCKVALVPFAFYMITFPMIFAAIAQNQYRSFVAQSTALMTDVFRVWEPGDYIALENRNIFDNARSFNNARIRYPILSRLIYNNDEIWWTNRNRMIELFALPQGAIRRVGEDSRCSQQNRAALTPDLESARWSVTKLGGANTDWVDFNGVEFTGALVCVLSQTEGAANDGPGAIPVAPDGVTACVLPTLTEQQENAIAGNFRRAFPTLRAVDRNATISAYQGVCTAMLDGVDDSALTAVFNDQFGFIEGLQIGPEQRDTISTWVQDRGWCSCR